MWKLFSFTLKVILAVQVMFVTCGPTDKLKRPYLIATHKCPKLCVYLEMRKHISPVLNLSLTLCVAKSKASPQFK